MTGSELFDESMRRAEADENAALRARVAELEEKLHFEQDAHASLHDIYEDSLDRVAELERWKESAMLVLGENHAALQQHGQLGEGAADCMNRLAKQVEALADALEMLRNEDNCWCDGPEKDRRGETDMTTHYGYCSEIRAALRAAGRKT